MKYLQFFFLISRFATRDKKKQKLIKIYLANKQKRKIPSTSNTKIAIIKLKG